MFTSLTNRRNALRSIISSCVALWAAVSLSPLTSSAQTSSAQTTSAKPAIVLVHGAWADASSWDAVIPMLKRAGYTVYAPPNPLRGLSWDAATISYFLKSISGPVILVGHSYGGAVISVASASDANIKALVYIDAFVPDEGENTLQLANLRAPSGLTPKTFVPVLIPNSRNADVYVKPASFPSVFASDLNDITASTMAVTQRPITLAALTDKAPVAEGWKTIPSWYVVGDADRVIPPVNELFMARRAKSKITHVADGGHTSMISHPDATVNAIMEAAHSTMKR